MIAEQNLLRILAAADKSDADDVAIRAALCIALRAIDGEFAGWTRRRAAASHAFDDVRRPPACRLH